MNAFYPTVRQRRLAIALRQLREAAGLGIDDVAETAGLSPEDYADVEAGRVAISSPALQIVTGTLYADAPLDQRRYLLRLCEDGYRVDGYTVVHTASTPVWADMAAGLNFGACAKWMYEPTMVPGIFQTRQYAQSLPAGPVVHDTVDAVMARQDRLLAGTPLRAFAVIGEAALRTYVGGLDVMGVQLRRLLAIAELPHVMVRVLPQTAIEHANHQPLAILDFPSPDGDHGIGYCRTLTRTMFMDDEEEVALLRLGLNMLANASLSVEDSYLFIQSLARVPALL